MEKQSVSNCDISSNGGRYYQTDSFSDMPSLNQKVPVKYISDYPKFLMPHKHYPYRRLNDKHVENVMNNALNRYEDDIKKQEQEKFDDACKYKQ
jgi:hypothetical protein